MIETSGECILCTCWIDKEGLDIIEPYIFGRKSNIKVRIFSDGNERHVSKEIKARLKANPSIEYFYTGPRKRLHAKVHYYSFGKQYFSIVGSANLTGRGLLKNEEFSVKTSGDKSSSEHCELKLYLNKLQKTLIKEI